MFEEPKVRTIIRPKDTAFRSRIQTLEIENSRNFLDVREFLNSIKFPVIGNIRNKLNRNNNIQQQHPARKDAQRVNKYKQWEHEFDDALKCIEFPVKLSDVSKFAKRTNMSINVHTFDKKRIVPLEISIEEKKTHVDLLYLSEKITTTTV